MRPYGHRICDTSNNRASDYAGTSLVGRGNDVDCGRDVPAPQCSWFADRAARDRQSQAEKSQTLPALRSASTRSATVS
jgi:hypothetical protein